MTSPRVKPTPAGLSAAAVEVVLDPLEAIDRAFTVVAAGDIIVVQVDEVEPMLNRVMVHFERLVGSGLPPMVS